MKKLNNWLKKLHPVLRVLIITITALTIVTVLFLTTCVVAALSLSPEQRQVLNDANKAKQEQAQHEKEIKEQVAEQEKQAKQLEEQKKENEKKEAAAIEEEKKQDEAAAKVKEEQKKSEELKQQTAAVVEQKQPEKKKTNIDEDLFKQNMQSYVNTLNKAYLDGGVPMQLTLTKCYVEYDKITTVEFQLNEFTTWSQLNAAQEEEIASMICEAVKLNTNICSTEPEHTTSMITMLSPSGNELFTYGLLGLKMK